MEVKQSLKLTRLEARLRKRLTNSKENHFALLKIRIEKFHRHLELVQDQLVRILAEYQSYATSQDEFQRIFECLGSIDEMRGYFGETTGSAAVFFPLNMPLYALILYGIFPALVADRVYIRAPQRMTNLMQRLVPVLALQQYFANVEILFVSREDFINCYVATADVIIFTGKLSNAQYVMSKTKKNSLFLFNGWGCNPIVVGKNTDLEMAAVKAVEARLFSSGQDCAGPDMILVPQASADSFITLVKENLARVKIGPYDDYQNTVGPLTDDEQVRKIASIFLKSSADIVHGGVIEFSTSTIHPTIIATKLSQHMNFEELFAPVLFVGTYEDEKELIQYFEHSLYTANEMYVTLFGRCDYVEKLERSIIVRDKVIFDIDRGNDEFGGYSMGASFVASNRKITAKPVLVPREIFDYLQSGSSGHRLAPSRQKKVSKHARKAMIDHFQSNLIFGFVFGSIAREEATSASDINTMVILKAENKDQVEQYTSRLYQLHEQNCLTYRADFSTITITLEALNDVLFQLHGPQQFDDVSFTKKLNLFVEAFSGSRSGIGGDRNMCVEFGHKLMPYSKISKRRD